MGRPSTKLSPREAELTKLLQHAVLCFDADCAKCERIERDLGDGTQHLPDDPTERWALFEDALRALHSHALTIYDYLESAPVPSSVRRSQLTLVRNIEITQRLLDQPITKGARAKAPAAPKTKTAVIPKRDI